MLSNSVKGFLLLVLCAGYLHAEDVIVELPDGTIRGRTEITITDRLFYSFQGIPFAQPPVGDLRFKAPQPVEPWEGVVDATAEKNICYQVTNDRDDESEDCLFINVFTPQNPNSDDELLPVMFFIYGGGFVEGAAESVNYGAQHFMDYGVIIVTSNYRVGPFGFASTGDSAIPGNAGLKDQSFALQWVQNNIKYFRGDPDKVTIFGESAGSASVAYQVLSPKSKGLFRGAIGESGSALSPWAYQRKQVDITYETASYLNPIFADRNGTTTELYEYLLSVPAKELDRASNLFSQTESNDYIQIQQGFFWAPIVEHEHEDAFITKKMYEALEEGDINKVPLLIGVNSQEALFFADNVQDIEYKAVSFDAKPSLLIPLDMNIDDDVESQTAEEIKNIYTDTNFVDDTITLISYFSDQSFARSIIKHAELQSAYTDVYFYQFSYSGPLGGHATVPTEGFSDRVRHGEEMGYIFRRNYGGYNTTDLSQYPESDQLVFRRFITLFTNFAKYLDPTPEEDELLENIIWPQVNATDFAYLDIGSYSEVRLHPKEKIYTSWENIYEDYGVPPYDTY